jgi:tetratricopeptide (TPR) repeat protein
MGDDFEHYTDTIRNFYQNLSRCFYHIGDYKMSIQMGDAAVTMNRHYDGVYKYIALSYKGMEYLDAAIATMRKAKRYETPWDKEHCETVNALLISLLTEKALYPRKALTDFYASLSKQDL